MAELATVGDNGPATPPKKLGGATGKGWLPGQSGNPSGMRKRRPFTDALMAALAKPSRKKGCPTQFDAVIANLVWIMANRRGKEAIEAFKLVMSYTDGLPIQQVEVDIFDAARREAEARGLDPDKVVDILERVRARRAG